MRYRRFGSSDLVVSEVGFGTWTLVTDWWGRTDHPHAMITAALDAGINFIDTAPVYGTEGAGESILAPYLTVRDDIVITTKCGYDIKAERKFPGQSERPADWRPESIRQQCEDSLRRFGTDRIDLYQLHNPRIEPILADDLWDALLALKHEGKVRELGVALGPAIGWVEEGNRSIDERPIVSLQTVFNVLEQEPGLTFAARPRVQQGEVSLISRVPHASDSLSGKANPDTVFPKGDHRAHRNRDNMLDNFEKAETLSFLWAAETGRTIGQAAMSAILANPAFTTVLPTVLSVDDVVEYAAASDLPLTRRRARGGRRLVRPQLRPRRPLRHAAEVERLTHRCAFPPTNVANSSSRSRATCSRLRLSRHVDGRHRRGRRRHQAGALPALPEQARALRRAARRHGSAAARPSRGGDEPRDIRARTGGGGLPRVFPVRGR